MRNRTALTTAVTSSAPEPESRPAQGDLVFGKVAQPGDDGPGARVQDVELFDATLTLPRITGEAGPHARHEAGKPRHVRKAPRSRKAARAPEREKEGGMSLPLLIAGALAAGIGLTIGLTSGMDQYPPDSLTLTMPDLPPPTATPDTEPPATPIPPTTATAPPTETAAPATSSAPSGPRAAARRSTPPSTHRSQPSPARSSRPPKQPDTEVLRLGSTGPEVEDLQRRLQQLYLYLGSADGTFSESVEAALSRFQQARAIPEERGVYGPLTHAVLHTETDRDDRSDQNGWDDSNDDRREGGGWDD
ncbi:peptidoglycan-binding domain-containing protein [Streptomyces sp. NPDC003863]